MNATQIKYLRQRISERAAEKRTYITQKYQVKALTYDDKLAMIKDGRAVLRESVRGDYYSGSYISDYYQFPHDPDNTLKKRQEALDKLDKFTKSLLDQVILGDVDEALKMLATFDDFDV